MQTRNRRSLSEQRRRTLNGRPRNRFRNTKDPIGKKSRSPDSQRIRPSALPGRARRQTGPPHRELLQAVWGPDYGDQTDYLRVFITHLRKKIEPNPAKPQYILTEPWIGYRFGS